MNDKKQNEENKRRKRNSILICIAMAVVAILLVAFLNDQITKSTNKEISYNKFLSMVKNKEIEKIQFKSNMIYIQPKDTGKLGLFQITYYTGYINDEDLIKELKNSDIEFGAEIQSNGLSIIDIFFSYILPIVILWGAFFFIMRSVSKGGGIGGFGKSNAKMYVEKKTGVTFANVAGQEEAKESLDEMVDFLKNPDKYKEIGAKLPKGALLVGPPGTGKTLLAKALAGEASVPFFSLSGSDFVEMFVGVGASRVRDLFKQATDMAPCIIFIDEIDAIGKSRDSQYGGGNDEREQTLNALLSEMDGFDSSKGIVILGATNRPEVLDKALLRPGRFDRRIIVEKPDLKGRVDILRVHSKDVRMDETVDLEAIALATSGAVGADLANMVNEAAIMAVKNGRGVVNQSDLFESVEVVLAGKEKKDRILGKEEKKIVAYHEIGHALVTTLLKNAEPVQKITIVPRTMGALGYVMQVPEEEKYLMKKEELLDRIVTLFGGRAAEEVVFDSITTGASNDIEKATDLARAMITQCGMSDKFGMITLEQVQNKYLDGRTVMNCGEKTASEVDKEVMNLLKECYEKAKQLITDNQEVLGKLAEHLVKTETITGEEFVEIYEEITGIKLERKKPEALSKPRKKPKLFIVDVDGTLVNSKKQITQPVKDAMKKMMDAGVKVCVASGRSVPGTMLPASEIGLPEQGGYIVVCNGTKVLDVVSKEVLCDVSLPQELIPEIYDFSIKNDLHIMTYHDGKIVAETTEDPYINLDATGCKIDINKVEDFVAEVTYPVNKCLLAGDPEKMGAIERLGQEQFKDRLSVYRSDPYYLEMMPLNVDKTYGIKKMIEKLGISKDEIIACGDGYNDIGMIEFAGFGVAMGGAVDEVKRVADYVAPSSDEDGLVDVIEKFVLDEN